MAKYLFRNPHSHSLGMFGSRYFLYSSPNIWQSISWSQYLVNLRSCQLSAQFLMISSLHRVEVKNNIFLKRGTGMGNLNNAERIKCCTQKQIPHPPNANKSHIFQISQESGCQFRHDSRLVIWLNILVHIKPKRLPISL